MAYFNHAFNKVFLGTQVSGSGSGQNPNPNLTNGFLTLAGVNSVNLGLTSSTAANNYGVGSYGFFDPKTGLSVDSSFAASSSCCPLVLASASLLSKDKLNNFIGGYKESNKSKIINPKYVRRFYKVASCTPQQAVVSIGKTPYTTGTSPATPGCSFDFLCGETYNLRIDLKGSPALRFLNHNAYQTFMAYTGCCAGPVPTAVDSTLVMIDWATQITTSAYTQNFVAPVVFDEAGTPWYAPGTTLSPLGIAVVPSQWWTAYVSPGHTVGATAGIRLFGAYVETKFGNCSFQLTDFFEKESIRIYASLTDLTGDPCTFEGICVVTECPGVQGMGFGEQVVRDLILSESYLQNHFPTDIRIREIEQGNDILNAVDRNALYTRYYILHSVPRFNNPSGTFDNDQYLLEIISTGTNAALESFMGTWLSTCVNCVSMETISCTHCSIVAD